MFCFPVVSVFCFYKSFFTSFVWKWNIFMLQIFCGSTSFSSFSAGCVIVLCFFRFLLGFWFVTCCLPCLHILQRFVVLSPFLFLFFFFCLQWLLGSFIYPCKNGIWSCCRAKVLIYQLSYVVCLCFKIFYNFLHGSCLKCVSACLCPGSTTQTDLFVQKTLYPYLGPCVFVCVSPCFMFIFCGRALGTRVNNHNGIFKAYDNLTCCVFVVCEKYLSPFLFWFAA